MCNKTMLIMTAAINISLVALFAKLMEHLNKIAPVGYQDESGFHLGNGKN
jgi:hypothetical protein